VTADNAALGEAGAMLRAVDGIKSAVLKHLEPSLLPDFEPLTSILKPIAKLVDDVRATTAAVPAGAEAGAAGACRRRREQRIAGRQACTAGGVVWLRQAVRSSSREIVPHACKSSTTSRCTGRRRRSSSPS
jgi:hypothetical protein